MASDNAAKPPLLPAPQIQRILGTPPALDALSTLVALLSLTKRTPPARPRFWLCEIRQAAKRRTPPRVILARPQRAAGGLWRAARFWMVHARRGSPVIPPRRRSTPLFAIAISDKTPCAQKEPASQARVSCESTETRDHPLSSAPFAQLARKKNALRVRPHDDGAGPPPFGKHAGGLAAKICRITACRSVIRAKVREHSDIRGSGCAQIRSGLSSDNSNDHRPPINSELDVQPRRVRCYRPTGSVACMLKDGCTNADV